MENFSVMMAVCLLLSRSACQAVDEGSQTQNTELTHEDQADTWSETDAIQNVSQELETPAILTTNSTGTQQSTELEELGALEERLAASLRVLEETNKRLEASERRLSALNSMVTELSAEYHGQRRVAFSVALPVDGTIGPANVLYPLVYRHVITNIGGYYNILTGYFTAPVQGFYYFTFTSFCWEASSGSCGGSLYKNGNAIVSWYDYNRSHPSSGSNSAILHLQVGDHVNVGLWPDRRISDNVNKYSTFSGFLLFPM